MRLIADEQGLLQLVAEALARSGDLRDLVE